MKAVTSLHGRLAGIGPAGQLNAEGGLTFGESSIVNVTASTLTVKPQLHAGKTITLNRAAGVTCTLPAATGSGDDGGGVSATIGTKAGSAGAVAVASALRACRRQSNTCCGLTCQRRATSVITAPG